MSYIWLVRRILGLLKDEQVTYAEFDGEQIRLRFGDQELVIGGPDLQIELKGIR